MEAPFSPLSARAKPRDLQCAPRTSQIFLPNPNPQTEVSSRPKRSEVEGPDVPSLPITNVKWKRPSPLCHPERSRGICSVPLGPPKSSFQTPTPKQKCHPDRSVAKWRDMLFRRSQQRMWEWKHPSPLVIPSEAEGSAVRPSDLPDLPS